MPILAHDKDVRTRPREISELKKAVKGAGLGIPMTLPLERAAQLAMKLIGAGGRVDLDAPMSIRRAITMIKNRQAGKEGDE
tara:strand:+ start:14350 stop:14592 length:243 start_codon:yes stop_codon:yes gene_type:complete